MPYIIGTAGHIDHGKTSLIKALTGFDTDRLKEEKERGISIDLGFAHLDLADGTSAGIVDVPGHERFIKNMLAGAHGIDLVLFTVAADDGVMPQTEEHLDIVHLLGVKMAIFVITKADLVPPARVAEVGEEIDILTLGTVLENSPKIAVSSTTGQGIAELKERIAEILQSRNKKAPSGYFRLPVDRAFVLQGHGVVVTGTGLSGEIKVGEQVRCLPGDHIFRVRSLQVHGKSVESAGWGQRVAMNLTGPDRAEIERGHVICHEKISLVTDRFDAHLEVRPGARKGLKNHQRVRVHLGAAERLGKIVILGASEKIEPKQSAFCQIMIAEPLLALRGDHFILRDETARRTLAGGVIINPWAQRHKRGETRLQDRLDALLKGDTAALTEAYIESSAAFALQIEAIYQFLNVREDQIRDAIEQMKNLRLLSAEGERLYTTQEKWQRVKEQLLELLKAFHAAHPLVPGMDMEELARQARLRAVTEDFSRRHRRADQREADRTGRKSFTACQPSRSARGSREKPDGQDQETFRRAAVGAARFEGDREAGGSTAQPAQRSDASFGARRRRRAYYDGHVLSREQHRTATANVAHVLDRKRRNDRRLLPRSDRLQPEIHHSAFRVLRPRRSDHPHRRHSPPEVCAPSSDKVRPS